MVFGTLVGLELITSIKMRTIVFLLSFVVILGCKSSNSQSAYTADFEINDKEIKELITIADNYIASKSSGFYKVSFSVEYSDYKVLINKEKDKPCYHQFNKYPLKPFLKRKLSNTEIYYYASFLKPKVEIVSECDKDYKVKDFREKEFTLLSVCRTNTENIEVVSGTDVNGLFEKTKRKHCN